MASAASQIDSMYDLALALKEAAANAVQESQYPPAMQEGVDKSGEREWWRMVWCYERCHKAENEIRRKGFAQEAAKIGAGLVMFKKAKQFNLWIQRAVRPIYILITDWREAQPCTQAISDHFSHNRPIMTIVLCDSHRQAGRALEWANNRAPGDCGPVRVCNRENIQPNLINGLLRKYFSVDEGQSEVDSDIMPRAVVPEPASIQSLAHLQPAKLHLGNYGLTSAAVDECQQATRLQLKTHARVFQPYHPCAANWQQQQLQQQSWEDGYLYENSTTVCSSVTSEGGEEDDFYKDDLSIGCRVVPPPPGFEPLPHTAGNFNAGPPPGLADEPQFVAPCAAQLPGTSLLFPDRRRQVHGLSLKFGASVSPFGPVVST